MLADGSRAAAPRKRASGSPTSGARRAATATCRRCSAPSSTGCSRSCRSTARRCRPGSTRCRELLVALRLQPAQHQSAASDLIERFVDFDAVRDMRRPAAVHRRPPMCRPAGCACSRARRSPPTRSWPRPACRCCSRRSRSTACPIGTAAIIGNPAIFPFFCTTETEDVLVVQINPLDARGRRRTRRRRSSTGSTRSPSTRRCSPNFAPSNSCSRLIDEGALPHGTGPGEYRRINVHRIVLDSVGKQLTPASRLDTDFDFFEMLQRAGRRAGAALPRRAFRRHRRARAPSTCAPKCRSDEDCKRPALAKRRRSPGDATMGAIARYRSPLTTRPRDTTMPLPARPVGISLNFNQASCIFRARRWKCRDARARQNFVATIVHAARDLSRARHDVFVVARPRQLSGQQGPCDDALAAAQRSGENLVAVFEGYMSRSLKSVDTTLRVLRSSYHARLRQFRHRSLGARIRTSTTI